MRAVSWTIPRHVAVAPRRTPPDAGEVVAELLLMCDEFWPIDKPHTQRSGTSSRPRKAFALPHMVDVA